MTGTLKKPLLSLITALGRLKERNRFIDPPILLGGCARSGTTLLLSILSAHEHIFACRRELGLFNRVTVKNGKVHPDRIDRIYRCMLLHRVPIPARRWCEKSPSNIRKFENINTYFKGNFRFIQIVRDGRDVILSGHPRDKDRYWVEPERWIRDVSAGSLHADHPNMHTIRYEDLITQYEKTITGICRFLDIPVSPQILNWHQYAKVRRNKALFSEIGQLSDRSIGKWKRKEHEKRVKELTDKPAAIKLLRKYGYLEEKIQNEDS
jgi:hypothetical protein